MVEVALPDARGCYHLKGDISVSDVAALQAVGPIPKLSITGIGRVTVRLVKRLTALQSVQELWLWCHVTRRAMRQIVRLPGLSELDVLCICGPGSMAYFDKATSLKVFRANHYMTESDLLCVSRCSTIETLGVQNCELTRRALSALLALPALRSLDMEATKFDDAMARQVAKSKTISSLDLGATQITGAGLRSFLAMQQLRSLDLWATKLIEADLPMLCELPCLEYLSLGNFDCSPSLDPQKVVTTLLTLPSLKRVWLDGIPITAEQRALLEVKLDSVKITKCA